MRKFWRRLLGAALSLLGLLLICSVFLIGKVFVIVLGTLVLIVGVAFWQTADQAGYNRSTGIARMVEGANVSLEELYGSLEHLDTPFGMARYGGVKLLRRPCILFGPGADGSFVYLYVKRGNVFLSQCSSAFWLKEAPKPGDAQSGEGASFTDESFWHFSDSANALVNQLYTRIDALAKKRRESSPK